MSGDFLGSRTSAHVGVVLEGKHIEIMKVLLSSSYFLAFMSKHMSCGMEYHFTQFVSAVLVVSFPKILPIPCLLVWGEMLERQRGCCGREHCSAIAKTLCSQWLPSCCPKAQALRAAEGKMSSASARPNA